MTPPVDALEDSTHAELASCTAGVSAAQIEQELGIARAFRDSLAEVTTCGVLAYQFTGSVPLVLVQAAAASARIPSGFVYEGDGYYASGDVMRLALHLGSDTSFGRRGDRITFDVFDPEQYFTDFEIDASASLSLTGETTTQLSATFVSSGPGLELLGLGQNVPSPLVIDSTRIEQAIGALELRGDITLTDEQEKFTVTYELESEGTPLSETFAEGGDMAFSLVRASAVSTEGGPPQTLEVPVWNIVYTSGHGGTTDGDLEVYVRGGAFEYAAHMTFPHRRLPDVTLRCLE